MNWRIIEEGEIPSLPLGRIKAAFRIEHEADDELLRHFVQVAKQYMETYTQMILGNVRLEVTLDNLPKKETQRGLCEQVSAPLTWIRMPVGPVHLLELVSFRTTSGEWKDMPATVFQLKQYFVGVPTQLLIENVHSIRLTGRAGVSPISSLIQGVWLNLVCCLYDSEVVDMTKVRAVLRPLQVLKPATLI